MEKIKVVHIVESFGGGVFGSVSQLCNHIDKSKFQVSLIYSLRPETPPNFQKYLNKDVKLIYLPMVRELSPIRDIKSFIELYKILKRNKPDVVHLHSSKAGVLGRLATRILRIKKVFYSPRGFAFLREDVSATKRQLYYFFEKVTSLFGGVIIGCSTDEYNYAKRISNSAVMISNGVDLGIIESIENIKKENNAKVLIGTSGRISPQKNPQMFCKIAAALKNHNVHFVWIGDGELTDTIEKCDAKIDKTGWKTREQGLTFVSMLDIYVQTSLWEGMPISVLEAMALGKPVVATDIVGNRDLVIHGKTGFLAKNEEDFIQYVKILVDDKQIRKQMGDAGRTLIKSTYDIKYIVKQFQELYERHD